jgi:UrcA family protein
MHFARTNGLRSGIAAVIVGFVVSQGALADQRSNTETLTRQIDVSSLNLSTRAGAQEAYRRIAEVARTICSTPSTGARGVAHLKDQRDYAQPCFEAAVRGALDQVANTTGIDLKTVAGLGRERLVAGR